MDAVAELLLLLCAGTIGILRKIFIYNVYDFPSLHHVYIALRLALVQVRVHVLLLLLLL